MALLPSHVANVDLFAAAAAAEWASEDANESIPSSPNPSSLGTRQHCSAHYHFRTLFPSSDAEHCIAPQPPCDFVIERTKLAD